MARRDLVIFPQRPEGKMPNRRSSDLIDRIRNDFAPCFLNEHPIRVARIADPIAAALGYSNSWRRMLAVVATFHDIGKVHPECKHLYISGHLHYEKDSELKKLVTAEHQRRGPEVLANLNLGTRLERYRERIKLTCSHHHDDFMDLPRLRKEVYVVAVADAWDALTSNVPGEEKERGYRKAKNSQEAAGILYQDALAGKYDPMVCIALVRDVLGLEEPRVFLPIPRDAKYAR